MGEAVSDMGVPVSDGAVSDGAAVSDVVGVPVMGAPVSPGVAVTVVPPVVAGDEVDEGVPGSEHPTSPNRRLAAATVKRVFFTIISFCPISGIHLRIQPVALAGRTNNQPLA